MEESRNGNQASNPKGSEGAGMTFRLQVPNALVGSIIGKQGEAIKAIREQSQAKVIIADSQPGEDRDVTLRGAYKSVEQAINLIISTIIQNRAPHPPPSYPPSSPSAHPSPPSDDPISLKVLVANDQAGAIIGKGGEAIKQLREETSARISIGKKVDFIRVVTVTGSAPSIRSALSALLKLVHDHPSTTRTSFQGFRAPPPAYPIPTSSAFGAGYGAAAAAAYNFQQTPFVDNMRCETLNLPNRSVGAIIGKGGQNINNIRMMSGCRIDVANQTEESPFRTITLTGSQRSVDLARLLIQQANSQMSF